MTEEGRVKDAIKKILKRYAPYIHYHMPIQNGMGSPTLDFNGCAWGRYFAIEAKAPGKVPTARQDLTIVEIRAAGGKVFVIDGGVQELNELTNWLEDCVNSQRE